MQVTHFNQAFENLKNQKNVNLSFVFQIRKH